MEDLRTVEVVSLFVARLAEAKEFYTRVFEADILFEDEVSAVLAFNNLMFNLLQADQAPELVEPSSVASPRSGASFMFTVKVADIAAVLQILADRGVTLLNGPIDRPWGRRTAAFADPDGFVWEIAQEL